MCKEAGVFSSEVPYQDFSGRSEKHRKSLDTNSTRPCNHYAVYRRLKRCKSEINCIPTKLIRTVVRVKTLKGGENKISSIRKRRTNTQREGKREEEAYTKQDKSMKELLLHVVPYYSTKTVFFLMT